MPIKPVDRKVDAEGFPLETSGQKIARHARHASATAGVAVGLVFILLWLDGSIATFERMPRLSQTIFAGSLIVTAFAFYAVGYLFLMNLPRGARR